EPDGFMPRDEIVRHLEEYAASFAAPVREGVDVTGLEAAAEGGFKLSTSHGEVRADTVVLCTGAYQRPYRPAGAAAPPGLLQLDAEGYSNEAALPPGKDRKSTRLNSSHVASSYAVFCLKKKDERHVARLDGTQLGHAHLEVGQ